MECNPGLSLSRSSKGECVAGHEWSFDLYQARKPIYARFASPWTYLADLYNQLIGASLAAQPLTVEKTRVLDIWWAGFMEDAEDLHMATKSMFAAAIQTLLAREGVRKACIEGTAGGEARLVRWTERIEMALNQASGHQAYRGSGRRCILKFPAPD